VGALIVDDGTSDQSDRLSLEEIQAGLDSLADAEWAKLRVAARYFAAFLGWDAEDLLQEALLKVLEGKRNCPRHISLVACLKGTMKSIASSIRGRQKVAARETAETQLSMVRDNAPMTLEVNLAQQEADAFRCEEVLDLFYDDDEARAIVEGELMDDMSTAELRELTGLKGTAYASKRKKISRRISAFLKGEKK
jgi:DNA-directed RNA polymerase specialized sigma24 family protein